MSAYGQYGASSECRECTVEATPMNINGVHSNEVSTGAYNGCKATST